MADIALDLEISVEGQHRQMEISMGGSHKYMAIEIERGGSLPVPEYEGPYNVVPTLYYGQALETEGKKMSEDVTVDPIPVTITSNPYGGETVVIG